MCGPQRVPDDAASFDPRVKCCSYEPRLANFLVGRILQDNGADAQGRATIEDRIARRVAVSPLGLDQSARFNLLYKSAPHGFGRALAFRCPHYVDTQKGGRCGIWAHRNGVCATWFCKHDRGAAGQAFWARLGELLGAIETDLSMWCTAELGAGSRELLQLAERGSGRMDLAELEGPRDTERYQRLWGTWVGKEKEYYQASAQLVDPLDWNNVMRRCGPRVRLLADLARQAYDNLASDEIPARLWLENFKIEGVHEGGKLRIASYSGNDPVLIPERLARALPFFTGQPWQEAVEAIRVNLNMQLRRDLVRRLVDFGILRGREANR